MRGILGSTVDSSKRHRTVYASDPRVCPPQDAYNKNHCLQVYIFALGGSLDGPTELLENDPLPMLVQYHGFGEDVIVLNIQMETRQMLPVGHSGRDISTLASRIPKTNIHWISITKQHNFWELAD